MGCGDDIVRMGCQRAWHRLCPQAGGGMVGVIVEDYGPDLIVKYPVLHRSAASSTGAGKQFTKWP